MTVEKVSQPIFCDWCNKQVRAWYTCPKDGTISCRPCLDKGYRLRKEKAPCQK